MTEHWMQILDYPNYEVSNFGNTRHIKFKRILKNEINKDGYHRFKCEGGSMVIHKLVAITFGLPGRSSLRCEVDHIDRDKSNNCLTNLRWASKLENMHNQPDITFSKFKNVYYRVPKAGRSGYYQAAYRHAGKYKTKTFGDAESAYEWVQSEIKRQSTVRKWISVDELSGGII